MEVVGIESLTTVISMYIETEFEVFLTSFSLHLNNRLLIDFYEFTGTPSPLRDIKIDDFNETRKGFSQ